MTFSTVAAHSPPSNEAGKFGSGGSRQYWKTIVYEGARFIVYHVPESMIDEDNGIFEVIEKTPENRSNREELMKEKEKLMARITEIDNLLSE